MTHFSKVVVGDHDITGSDGGQKVAPKKWIIHPDYKKGAPFNNDFAIIKLATPVKFSYRVSPICLPSPSANYDNRVATVTGWGRLSFKGKLPTILQKVYSILNLTVYLKGSVRLCVSYNVPMHTSYILHD